MAFTRREHTTIALCALGITLLQILSFLIVSAKPDWKSAYLSFYWWDAGGYGHIAEFGYRSEYPLVGWDVNKGNVAFFPSYPIFIQPLLWLIKDTQVASILTAQWITVVLWYYFILLLRLAGHGAGTIAILALLGMSHPASLFLVAAYSEPIAIASTLGFLFWAMVPNKHRFLAVLHGLVMVGSRVLFLSLTVAPLAASLPAAYVDFKSGEDGKRKAIRRLIPLIVVGLLSSVSFGLFLFYCHKKFGHWDMYFYTVKTGWGSEPRFGAILNPSSYSFCLRSDWHESGCLSKSSAPVLLLWLLFCSFVVGKEYRRRPMTEVPPLLTLATASVFAAWTLLALAIAGSIMLDRQGMIRYTVPPFFLSLVALGLAFEKKRETWLTPRRETVLGILAVAVSILMLSMQFLLVSRYSSRNWVS